MTFPPARAGRSLSSRMWDRFAPARTGYLAGGPRRLAVLAASWAPVPEPVAASAEVRWSAVLPDREELPHRAGLNCLYHWSLGRAAQADRGSPSVRASTNNIARRDTKAQSPRRVLCW